MQPSVGRIVHYVSYGTPGGEYRKECRAAVVTEVHGPHIVDLCVMNPTGLFFNRSVVLDDDDDPGERKGGSWHWPERVEEAAREHHGHALRPEHPHAGPPQ